MGLNEKLLFQKWAGGVGLREKPLDMDLSESLPNVVTIRRPKNIRVVLEHENIDY